MGSAPPPASRSAGTYHSRSAPQPMSRSAVEAGVRAAQEATIGARGPSDISRTSLKDFWAEEITTMVAMEDLLQEVKVAGLFPSSPVLWSTSRSATVFPRRAAGRCLDRNAPPHLDSSVAPFPSKAAGLFQDK